MRKAKIITLLWAIGSLFTYALIGHTDYFFGLFMAYSAWELYLINEAIKKDK
jgi:hypothetical protein